ncbi:MAG: RIP metalloprotease RseP [Lachnospiraceae bacterium]|nr:RIP metalloprotease RseP [Lachnospiraceae bacterium]
MSILISVIIFGVIIFIHEFGHFIMAKKNGIYVVEFSIGMGPTLFKFKKGETVYALKALPLGGACQMLNKEMADMDIEGADYERAFETKSVWARMVVIAAGPVFNFVLAFVLALIVIGFAGYDIPEVLIVSNGSAAQDAGLMEGDIIVKYNGKKVDLSREVYLQQYIHPVSDEEIELTVLRDGEKIDLTIEPKETKRYALGISYTADDNEAVIAEVADEGAAMEAGIEAGDVILAINDDEIANGSELNQYLSRNPLTEDEIEILIKRDGEEIIKTVSPSYSGELYVAGFSYNLARTEAKGLSVIKYSFAEVKYQIVQVFESLAMLFKGQLTVNDFTGPVGIADIIDDVYEQSESGGFKAIFLNFANFTIMLSANLGVMNLLPIPGLDGGRLLFLIYEAIVGKPVKKEEYIHLAGLLLLMLFAFYIMFKDIVSCIRS